MKPALLLFSLGALLTIAHPDDVNARCFFKGRVKFSAGGSWPLYLSMTDGSSCINVHFAPTPLTQYKTLNAFELPEHGKLELKQGGIFSYRPERDYKGRDKFLLQLCGSEGGVDSCVELPFDVRIE